MYNQGGKPVKVRERGELWGLLRIRARFDLYSLLVKDANEGQRLVHLLPLLNAHLMLIPGVTASPDVEGHQHPCQSGCVWLS